MSNNERNENRVLLVEDSEDDAALVLGEFKRANLTNPVCWVSSGKEAIKHLDYREESSGQDRSPLPSIVLLDISMPGMDGFDVLKWIRKQPHLTHLFVVILSETAYIQKIKLAYELGANSYLTKPLNFSDLVNLIAFFKGYWNVAAHSEISHPEDRPGPSANV